MRLIDIVTAPWAIQPEKLIEIRGIYETHLRGEKIDLKPIEAALGRPLDNRPQGYEVVDGVAVIPVDGVIAKRMNLFTQISGGVSTDLLARDFRAALEDTEVEAIVLDMDSPGGTVDGTVDVARLIYESRGTKPIVAFTDGVMASAAYWIGSAADNVYIGNDATSVGSIGVVATHTDVSKAEEQRGVKTTEIYAGRYKRVASQYAPLSDEGRATIQERVDYIYSVFVNAVAAHRDVPEREALAMADGRVFMGTQAVEAGLVDGVSTMDAVIATINNKRKETVMSKGNEVKETAEAPAITAEYLAESHRDVYEAIKALGYDEGKLAGVEEGAKAERERIRDVFSLYRPGREKLVGEFMFDGKTTKEGASVAILDAEDARRDALRKDHAEDGSEVKVDQAEPGMTEPTGAKRIEALVAAYRKDHGCDEKEALLAVSREHPELFRERR